MPVPKQKHSKSRKNTKRAHHFLSAKKLTSCSKCGSPIIPHRLCGNCGTYAGREVVDVLSKLNKKERKDKAKQLAEQEQAKDQSLDMTSLSQK